MTSKTDHDRTNCVSAGLPCALHVQDHMAPSLATISSANAAFPNGNGNEVIIITSDGAAVPYRFDPDEAKYPLLIAQPHPYRDVSRLQPVYDPIPAWLFYANDRLASNAVAVIRTYPPDVEKISTHLLAVLRFVQPFHVLPVRQDLGTQVDHSEVLLVARRSQGITDLSCLLKYGMLPDPVQVAKDIVPTAKRAFLLFVPEGFLHGRAWSGSGLGAFIVSDWGPWED